MIIRVDFESFNMLVDGTKTHEICIYNGESSDLKDNNVVVVQDTSGRWFTALVTRVCFSTSLEDIFRHTHYKMFTPNAFSINHAIMIYEDKPNFRHEELNGLVSFRIKRISEPDINFRV